MAISMAANNIRGIVSETYPTRKPIGRTRTQRSQAGRRPSLCELSNLREGMSIRLAKAKTVRPYTTTTLIQFHLKDRWSSISPLGYSKYANRTEQMIKTTQDRLEITKC